MLTVDMVGLAAAFGALPWAARRGPRAVGLALGAMGLFFGPLLSATSVVKNHCPPRPPRERP